jgi:hypothetical protein
MNIYIRGKQLEVYKTEREDVLVEIEQCRKREINMKNSRAIDVNIRIYIYIYICIYLHV